LLSFLSDNIWKYYDVISELLFEYRQPSLGRFSSDSYNKCRMTRDEFIIYNAIINNNFDFQSMEDTKLLNDIILHFSSILHDDERLESEKNKFEAFVKLFGYSHMVEDEAITNKFYDLMKAILQYCTGKAQVLAKGFDYSDHEKRQLQLVLECLFNDELALKFCAYKPDESRTATDIVMYKDVFQIIPYSSDFYTEWIMWDLRYEIALKWHQSNSSQLGEFSEDRKDFMEDLKNYLNNSDCQAQLEMCEILSLSTLSSQLNDDDINELIEVTEHGFKVSFRLYRDGFWIKSMEFRTQSEAIDYVKSNFRKIVYSVSLYFDNA